MQTKNNHLIRREQTLSLEITMNNSSNNQNSSDGIEPLSMAVESSEDLSAGSDDNDDACQSSSGSTYKENSNLRVTAITSAKASLKKKKRGYYSFETNPFVRKRQKNRLLKKLKQTLDEYATRVGQQAIILVVTPDKPNSIYKVFGAKPLRDIIENFGPLIVEELQNVVTFQVAEPVIEESTLFQLPPLSIDGVPTPLEKMTQAQLRTFIPLMLKYSTGRGKPNWGNVSMQPPWWPKQLPWANVRMDSRTADEKQMVSWTHALQQVVSNCYKYHGREDLLPPLLKEVNSTLETPNTNVGGSVTSFKKSTITTQPMDLGTNPDEIVSFIRDDSRNPFITLPDGMTNNIQRMAMLSSNNSQEDSKDHLILESTITTHPMDLGTNPASNPFITLPDGMTTNIQGMATLSSNNSQDDSKDHLILEIQSSQGETIQAIIESPRGEVVDLNSIFEANLNSEGQIIVTAKHKQENGITLPVSADMY